MIFTKLVLLTQEQVKGHKHQQMPQLKMLMLNVLMKLKVVIVVTVETVKLLLKMITHTLWLRLKALKFIVQLLFQLNK